MIDLLNRQRKVPVQAARLSARLQCAMQAAGVAGAEVSLMLVSDRAIRVLNRRWRGHDRPTDCLSFPSRAPDDAGPSPEPHLGDIVISMERAREQGLARAKPGTSTESAIEEEVVALFIHSLLHLLGYDHETDAAARRMRARERRLARAARGPQSTSGSGRPVNRSNASR